MSINSRPHHPALALFAISQLLIVASINAQTVDPVKMVDAFEAAGGKFDGFRRSGAKGICATGEFVGGADGRNLSSASPLVVAIPKLLTMPRVNATWPCNSTFQAVKHGKWAIFLRLFLVLPHQLNCWVA
jgi:hypothetical protein